MEHGVARRGGHRALCRRRHAGGVVRGANRPAGAPRLRRPAGDPARHPGLRGELRLARPVPVHRWLLGGRPGHDAGRLSPGLPPRRGQPARRRPGPRRGGAQPRSGPGAHLLDGHRRPGPPRHPGGVPPGGTGGAGRVRRVRDPGLPDADHRDLQRVPGRFQRAGCVRAVSDPRAPRGGAPGGGGLGPGPGPGITARCGGGAGDASGAARPRPPGGLRRSGPVGRAGAGRPCGLNRLPDRPGRHHHFATGLVGHRHREHLRLRRGGRPRGHRGGAAGRPALGALPPPAGDGPGAVQHGHPGRARARGRPELHLPHRAFPAGTLLPDEPSPGTRLHDHVLPPRRRRRARRRGPVAGRAGGGGGLAGCAASLGPVAGDPPSRRTGPRRSIRAGLLGDRDRAHRDPRPPPHERRDVGDPVLGLPVERVLQPGGGVRRGHGAHRRRARVRARALVRPPTRPGGRRRCGGSGHRGRGPRETQGVAAA